MSTDRPLPLSIGNALDLAVTICLRRFLALVKAVFFIVAPLALVSTIVEVWVLPETLLSPDSDASASEVFDELRSALGGLAVVGLIGALGGILASAACFRIIAGACLGREVDWLESVRYALARFPAVLWVTVLAVAAIILGALLCLLPGLWLGVVFSLATPVVLTENLRGGAALGRSRALVSGRFWPVLGLLALGWIIGGVISVGVSSIGDAVDPTTSSGFVVAWATDTIGSTLATPIVAAVTIVLYLDLRVRKERLTLVELGGHLRLEPTGASLWPEGPADPAPAAAAGADDAGEGPRDGSATPPFWPPPPGWQSGGDTSAGAPTEPGSADDDANPASGQPNAEPTDAPPFWPPPPGWTPPTGATGADDTPPPGESTDDASREGR